MLRQLEQVVVAIDFELIVRLTLLQDFSESYIRFSVNWHLIQGSDILHSIMVC